MKRINRKLRVAVARDVLKQMRLGRFNASHVYVDVEGQETIDEDQYTESFQKLFQTNKRITCNVCALGAAFMSLINLKNECSVGEILGGDDKMFERLRSLYGGDNISLMESAFERDACHNGGKVSEIMLEAAVAWGHAVPDDTQRLRKIMLNIIRNNGDFKLPKRFVESFKKKKLERRRKREQEVLNWA